MEQFGFAILSVMIAFLATVQAAPSISGEPVCTSGRLDLVLVVDVSGSNQRRFEAHRDAALDIARSLPIGAEKVLIAVIQYSKTAIMKLQFRSSENFEIVNETIWSLDWTGGIALGAEAMDLAMIQFRLARSNADRVIVLLSDGNSLNSWNEVTATAERLRYSKSKIFAVSLGGSTYEPELKAYIGHSNGTIIRSQSEVEMLKKELLKYTVPACRSGDDSSFISNIEAKHAQETGGDEPKVEKSSEVSKEEISVAGSEHATSTTHGKTASQKHNSTHHNGTTPLKTTSSFVAFPKKSTSTSKTTSRTTRKPTTRSSSLRTTHHSTVHQAESNGTSSHANGHNTPTPTGTASNTPTATATEPEASTPVADVKPTTVPDIFDPVARQQAIEKMIDKAAHL